ncbi:MAG TPA: PAS domain-containing protein [Opitutaceae bacterium]|nr:PAS domain-containing protein [Opitutaceae bacterium]
MTPVPTRPRILVVDDDEGLRTLMADALPAEEFDVATAGSGAEALAWLEANTPDLMLLDLKMRDVGGQALVKRLKQHRAPVPFLVVTGQGDEKVAVDVMKQGALDYVMKDTGLLDLLPGVVRRALETIERDRELARTQANLRESEARFAAAVRATNDGVWEWWIQHAAAYFSPRWKAILGYEPDEIADDREEWHSRVHPQDVERVDKVFRECLEGSASNFSVEYRLRHKDGSYRWIDSRAVLIRDAAGKPLRMIGANADITERKQLEKELLSISDREQRRIGQDLHDGLGQQLTAIELMCQSLRSDLNHAAPEVREQVSALGAFLRQAIGQTRALAHGLTVFMLDASGLQGALAELVESTGQLARVRCEFVCPSPVRVKDNETAVHLYRIAQEAIGNALKHSGASRIQVSIAERAGVVVLTVTDDGKGIARTSGDDARGVGLQVMRHRAATIGADLAIDSKRGRGVTVTCTVRQGR